MPSPRSLARLKNLQVYNTTQIGFRNTEMLRRYLIFPAGCPGAFRLGRAALQRFRGDSEKSRRFHPFDSAVIVSLGEAVEGLKEPGFRVVNHAVHGIEDPLLPDVELALPSLIEGSQLAS
jgi:hypothetical protein